jgi:hypothetical protein
MQTLILGLEVAGYHRPQPEQLHFPAGNQVLEVEDREASTGITLSITTS